jgi:hypothetical protein
MDENYIPGFTNYLNSGVSSYGMAAGQPMYNDVTLYGDKVGSPYGLMSDEYNTPVGTMDIGGGDFAMAGPSPSRVPTPAVTSPYARPSATPGLDFVTDRGGQQGYYFVTNAGRAAKTKANPTGFVSVDPNAQYRLVNERGQNVVVTSGSGEQGLRDAYAAAQRLSTEGGTKANWYLERSGPEGQWTRIADDDPKGSDLGVAGKILGAALPIATAFIPGLGVLGTIAMQAASGAAGSALAGGDPLKGAVMGGLTAAGGSVLGPALGSATGIGARTAGAIGTGLGATAGGLATGQNLQNSLLGGLTSGAGSYFIPGIAEELGITLPGTTPSGGGSGSFDGSAITVNAPAPTISPPVSFGGGSGSNLAGDAGADTLGSDEIVVTGGGTTPSINLAPIFTPSPQPVPIPQPLETGAVQQPTNPDEIVVTGGEPLPPSVPVTLPIPSGGLPPVDYEAGIDVTATRPTVPEQPTSVPVTPPITPSRIDLGFTGARDGATAPEEGGTTLRDIADYLRLAGIGTSLLGGLVGGGGGGGGQRFNIPSTMGRLSPVFGGSLPAANLPGLGGGTAGATRPPSELAGQGLRSPIDYYRYGYGPEQSFYSYVPQGAPNTSQAYTGYYEGGHAVEGPGDGRDDQIPALLSDGEYVIDAETVALLGNGSNKAGAEMLDAFRVNVRKQKGQKLARGEFSENAKRPEHYMAGGQA